MEQSTDIVVIGEGLAGLAAALSAKQGGKEVCVVSRCGAGTSLSSGAWDLVDHPFPLKGRPWLRPERPRDCLDLVLHQFPDHPYSILLKNFQNGKLFEFIAEQFRKISQVLPLEFFGDPETTLTLLTPLGTVKSTALVQASMAEGDLGAMERARVLVVGIEGYPEFNARFLAQALREGQEAQGKVHLEFVGHCELSLARILNRFSRNAFELAHALDEEQNFVEMGQELARYLQGKIYTHLLFPPVLGIANTAALVAALRKITGLKVSETLALPTSIPGLRLQEAIQKCFAAEKIKYLEAEVLGYSEEGRKIRAVTLKHGGKDVHLSTKAVVLATGKFIGGGIRHRQTFSESLFSLPVYGRDRWLGGEAIPACSRPTPGEVQPFLAAGVRINPLTQALDERSQIVWDNLFAAGGVLAGWDPSHERCGAGVSLVSGALAGRHAAQLI